MKLTSEALRKGEIPVRYTKDGQNVSPPLGWSDLPPGTKELAPLFENITPETKEPFVQWLVCKIRQDAGGLPEGFKHKREPKEPADMRRGRNSLGNIGYDGRSAPSAGRFATASACSRWISRSTCRPGPLPATSSSGTIWSSLTSAPRSAPATALRESGSPARAPLAAILTGPM
jgi:hypothetical protein